MDASHHAHRLRHPVEGLAAAFAYALRPSERRHLTGHEEVLAGLAFLVSRPKAKSLVVTGRVGYDGKPEIAAYRVPRLSVKHTRMLHDAGWTLVETTPQGNTWVHPTVGDPTSAG